MTTEIQAEANRRNALQSTGPRTGKESRPPGSTLSAMAFEPCKRSFPGKHPRNGKPIAPRSWKTGRVDPSTLPGASLSHDQANSGRIGTRADRIQDRPRILSGRVGPSVRARKSRSYPRDRPGCWPMSRPQAEPISPSGGRGSRPLACPKPCSRAPHDRRSRSEFSAGRSPEAIWALPAPRTLAVMAVVFISHRLSGIGVRPI